MTDAVNAQSEYRARLMSMYSVFTDRPPSRIFWLSLSNSSPQPELSVWPARPTFTDVHGDTRAGTVIRAHTRRRRTTRDTSNPPIMVNAETSTHTWPGSWETWRLTNAVAPSKRVHGAVHRPPGRGEIDPLELVQLLLLDQPGVDAEQRLWPAGVQPGITAIDVDGHRRVVHRRKTGDDSIAVHLLGQRRTGR